MRVSRVHVSTPWGLRGSRGPQCLLQGSWFENRKVSFLWL